MNNDQMRSLSISRNKRNAFIPVIIIASIAAVFVAIIVYINISNRKAIRAMNQAINTDNYSVALKLIKAHTFLIRYKSPRKQNTFLHNAIVHNRNDIVELLLVNGADPRAKDKIGALPMGIACNYGNTNVIETLLKHGISTSEPCMIFGTAGKGTVPLEDAAYFGRKEAVKMLLNKGADVNFGTMDSPLVTAIYGYGSIRLDGTTDNINAYMDIIDLLISNGADINGGKSPDTNPLLVAATKNKMPIVKHLIMKGAQINWKDQNNKSLLDLARERKCSDEVVKLLIVNGAK